MDGITHADLMGVGKKFVFEEKEYEVKPLNQVQQGQYQRWLEDRALAAILRDTDSPPDMVKSDRREFVHDRAAGIYEWLGDVAEKARGTWSGAAKYLEIALSIDADTARRMIEKESLAIIELIGRIVEEDPLAVRQLLKKMGLPQEWEGDWRNETSSSDSSTRPSTGHSPNSWDSPTISSLDCGLLSSETSRETPDSPSSENPPSATDTSSSDGSSS